MTLVLFFFLCCQATWTEKKKFTCTVLVKQNRFVFVFVFSYFLTNEQECSSCRFITLKSIHPTVSLSCLLFKKVLGWLELEPILVDFGCNRNTQVKVNSKYIILCGLYYKPSEQEASRKSNQRTNLHVFNIVYAKS